VERALVVSAHLDDAVFSAGQFLAAHPGTVVLTVFAGAPQRTVRTSWDTKCGFTNSDDALATRREEDRAGLAVLDARPTHFDFLDDQYLDFRKRRQKIASTERLASSLAEEVERHRPTLVVGPLGVSHPDHARLRRALLSLNLSVPVLLYADLPYCVGAPKKMRRAEKSIDRNGFTLQEISPHLGSRELKFKAVRCYSSQLGNLPIDSLLSQERYFKLNKSHRL